MAWDDLHEPGGSQDKFKGGGPPKNPGGGSGGGPQFDIPQIKVPKFKPSHILIGVIALLAVWIGPSIFYLVEPDAEGVVTRFGEYNRTTQPGPHWKLPSPIELVYKPRVRQIQRVEIGFRINPNGNGQTRDVPRESLMLTKELYIVDIDLVVQFDIKEAKDYLFNIRDKEKVLRDVAETVIRGIVGNKEIDKALITGKAEIQQIMQVQMQALLDSFKSGIRITGINLQAVDPPAQVAAAFKDVVSAKEDKEAAINKAEEYREKIVPEARGDAEKIVRGAEAYREQTVKKALGDTSRFLAQYEEYKKAPDVTRKRIYLETMEEVYPKMQKFVMGSKNSGVLPILPLGKNQSLPLTNLGKNR
jgi:membrane protease subunit HflK